MAAQYTLEYTILGLHKGWSTCRCGIPPLVVLTVVCTTVTCPVQWMMVGSSQVFGSNLIGYLLCYSQTLESYHPSPTYTRRLLRKPLYSIGVWVPGTCVCSTYQLGFAANPVYIEGWYGA